jgi:2-dehydropantoate 2-reductase
LLGEKTVLLTLQNGLRNEEFLARHFGAERVLGGLCYVCLTRTSPGVVTCDYPGRLTIGEFNRLPLPRTHDIAWEFKRCGVVCTVTADLALERWRKLVWNIPFNGLAVASGGIDTAKILADDVLRQEALALMDETIAIANACGHKIPTALALDQMKRTATMGAFEPSSVADYRAGRPLEIEPIWGEPLRRGRAAGVAVPRLDALYRRLVALNPAAPE